MRKFILAGLATAVVFACAAGAQARDLFISHGSLWREEWFPLSFRNGGTTIASCTVILEGSFHYAHISKASEALIGSITRASLTLCSTGSATVLTESLPWHVCYRGFTGLLPSITGLKLGVVGMRFRIRENIFGIECLSTTEALHPAVTTALLEPGEGNRNITSVVPDANARIPCSIIESSFGGSSHITEFPSGTRILVVLI